MSDSNIKDKVAIVGTKYYQRGGSPGVSEGTESFL